MEMSRGRMNISTEYTHAREKHQILENHNICIQMESGSYGMTKFGDFSI